MRILADPHGELAKGLGLELEAAAIFGTNRSKRYSAVIQDNEIKVTMLLSTKSHGCTQRSALGQ